MIQCGGARCTISQNMISLSGGFRLNTNEIFRSVTNLVEAMKSDSAYESGLPHNADSNGPSSSSDVIPRGLNSYEDGVYKQILNALLNEKMSNIHEYIHLQILHMYRQKLLAVVPQRRTPECLQ